MYTYFQINKIPHTKEQKFLLQIIFHLMAISLVLEFRNRAIVSSSPNSSREAVTPLSSSGP